MAEKTATKRKAATGRKSATKRKSTKAAKRVSPKTSATGKTAKRTTKKTPKKWSAAVTEHSDAMDLEQGVFKGRDAHKIALSIKRSAEASDRRKSDPYQSAMSMLTFYINRAGHNLSPARRKVLDAAKDHLREIFGRAE